MFLHVGGDEGGLRRVGVWDANRPRRHLLIAKSKLPYLQLVLKTVGHDGALRCGGGLRQRLEEHTDHAARRGQGTHHRSGGQSAIAKVGTNLPNGQRPLRLPSILCQLSDPGSQRPELLDGADWLPIDSSRVADRVPIWKNVQRHRDSTQGLPVKRTELFAEYSADPCGQDWWKANQQGSVNLDNGRKLHALQDLHQRAWQVDECAQRR
mmetsp:Transcript_14789/g.51853  ORF Transcript_14789/g.51853 Transcript_14789/m.51853 type:complete len:209 (-) Transcript_14789:940-1566(-)